MAKTTLGLILLFMILAPISVRGQTQSDVVIEDIKWHPARGVLAVAYNTGRVEVIDEATGTILFEQAVQPPIYEVEWGPDGALLAVSSAEKILVWDTAMGQLITTLLGSSTGGTVQTEAGLVEEAVYDMAWNTNNQLASIAISGQFRVWHMDNIQLLLETFVPQPGDIAWRPDNSAVLTVSGTQLVQINIRNGEKTPWRANGGFSDQAAALAWSPNGTTFVVGTIFGEIVIWDDTSPADVAKRYAHTEPEMISALDWSPDGSTIATVFADGSIWLYDAGTLEATQTSLEAGSIFALAWSPDGTRLAYGGKNGTLVISYLPQGNAGLIATDEAGITVLEAAP